MAGATDRPPREEMAKEGPGTNFLATTLGDHHSEGSTEEVGEPVLDKPKIGTLEAFVATSYNEINYGNDESVEPVDANLLKIGVAASKEPETRGDWQSTLLVKQDPRTGVLETVTDPKDADPKALELLVGFFPKNNLLQGEVFVTLDACAGSSVVAEQGLVALQHPEGRTYKVDAAPENIRTMKVMYAHEGDHIYKGYDTRAFWPKFGDIVTAEAGDDPAFANPTERALEAGMPIAMSIDSLTKEQFDFGLMTFGAEATTSDFEVFKQRFHNVISAVRPGGGFEFAITLGSGGAIPSVMIPVHLYSPMWE
jgi:hypothetical protein